MKSICGRRLTHLVVLWIMNQLDLKMNGIGIFIMMQLRLFRKRRDRKCVFYKEICPGIWYGALKLLHFPLGIVPFLLKNWKSQNVSHLKMAKTSKDKVKTKFQQWDEFRDIFHWIKREIWIRCENILKATRGIHYTE